MDWHPYTGNCCPANRIETFLLLVLRRGYEKGSSWLSNDWCLLVELLLEWEAFLCERKMKRSDVVRLKEKHKFIMYIMRNVAKRTKGMGLKIMKFHAILHLVEDILLYGVPSEVDTGGNESHHKTSKTAAKMTQRKESTFDYQTGLRMTEFLAIDLAELEVEEYKAVFDYYYDVKSTINLLAEEPDGIAVAPKQEDIDDSFEESELSPIPHALSPIPHARHQKRRMQGPDLRRQPCASRQAGHRSASMKTLKKKTIHPLMCWGSQGISWTQFGVQRLWIF